MAATTIMATIPGIARAAANAGRIAVAGGSATAAR